MFNIKDWIKQKDNLPQFTAVEWRGFGTDGPVTRVRRIKDNKEFKKNDHVAVAGYWTITQACRILEFSENEIHVILVEDGAEKNELIHKPIDECALVKFVDGHIHFI